MGMVVLALPTIAQVEVYHALKSRLELTLAAMHYNLAGSTDLTGLEQLATALERVICCGDRISVGTAQGVAAANRAAERAAAAEAALLALPDLNGSSAHGVGVSALPAALGGPLEAPIGLPGGMALDNEQLLAEGEILLDEPAPPAALASPLSPPAPPLPPLVVKQKPPIAKPGRGRGFVYTGKTMSQREQE